MGMQILMPSVSSAPWWRKPFVVLLLGTLWFVPAFFGAIDPDLGERQQGPIQGLMAVWITFVILTLTIWHYATTPIGTIVWADVAMHFVLSALYWFHVRHS